MEILDKKLEELITKFHGCKQLNIGSSDCEQEEIDFLIEKGYFTVLNASTLSAWRYLITATHKTNSYFENKKIFEAKKRNEKIIDWIKYGITTIIAIIALIRTF